MSKHNNSLNPSSHTRCKCGRQATIGEWKAGIGFINYICPDCTYRKQISREQYYGSFGIKVTNKNQ